MPRGVVPGNHVKTIDVLDIIKKQKTVTCKELVEALYPKNKKIYDEIKLFHTIRSILYGQVKLGRIERVSKGTYKFKQF